MNVQYKYILLFISSQGKLCWILDICNNSEQPRHDKTMEEMVEKCLELMLAMEFYVK